jgi:hypothetical protein
MCHSEGGLYICLPPKPSGPNWLDEPLKGFIVYPAYSLGSVRGSTGPGIWESRLTVKVYTSAQSLINWHTSRAHGYERPWRHLQ